MAKESCYYGESVTMVIIPLPLPVQLVQNEMFNRAPGVVRNV
jgi:hypothetical protein